MQHSIFEPLYSLQQAAHTMQQVECLQSAPALHNPGAAFAPSMFSISPPSAPSLFSIPPPSPPPLPHPTLCPPCSNGNSNLPLSHPTTPIAPASPCSNSTIDGRTCVDDGSVACKLLSSITKSISSPSLHLSSSKEAQRETPYQKTLKLKRMELQHCAEALGMESWDNSSFFYDSQCIDQQEKEIIKTDSKIGCPPPSFTLPNSLKSVKSAPNLSANHARYTRSTSFPPPLSHTLPTSSSYDSLSLSLRAHREHGRFILKETMVPSKHYFHASRRNGRLILHVLTREAEEEGSVDSQDDDEEELSNKECHHVEGEEQEEAKEEGVEDYSCNTIQSLDEEVCVNTNLGILDACKEERLNGLAIHNIKDNEEEEEDDDDDERHGEIRELPCLAPTQRSTLRSSPVSSDAESWRNVDPISNVITLSFHNPGHSKLTLQKAQVLSFPHLSSYPLVSGTLKQSALIHSSHHGLLPSKKVHDHIMSTCAQSTENFIWESDLMPQAVQASGSRHKTRRRGGRCGGGAILPAFGMEEKRAECLRKVGSELATSLIVEASYNGGNLGLAKSSGESGTILGGHASAIKRGDEGQISHGANFGNSSSSDGEERSISEGGIRDSNMSPSPLHFPSFNANSQSELEWLHTLHCKELFDRHQLGQGFIKLQCIPTRS